jgi:2-amino-4-hydroxy-6-hydroxymethyldihydropteridine diphosphokinase
MTNAALIALGSNVGDRRQWLDQAIQQLKATAGVQSVRASTWHETKAVGGPADQVDFLNGAAVVDTTLSPNQLWQRLREIEAALGRVRREKWGPRTIDLDLLLYDNLVQKTPQLELAHPRMAFRRFVLEPAAEVAPQMRHPVIGWTVGQLLQHLKTAAPYVAISGSLFRQTHGLAQSVAEKTGWSLIESPSQNPLPLGEGDRSSPSLSRPQTIEFLREQAALLNRQAWLAENRRGISSFWIEDLLAIADVLWPGAMDQMWQELSPTVVCPKLLVVYETDAEQFRQHDEDAGRTSNSPVAVALWHRLNEARRARAARAGIGPVLWLDAADPAAAAELVAAIQAME